MISFEVVPRTIESAEEIMSLGERGDPGNKLTIDEEDNLARELERHRVELAPDVLAPESQSLSAQSSPT